MVCVYTIHRACGLWSVARSLSFTRLAGGGLCGSPASPPARSHQNIKGDVMNQPTDTPQVLTVVQAAQALQMSTDSVLRLIRAGQLPAARLGRGYRLRPEALTEAVRRREMVTATT